MALIFKLHKGLINAAVAHKLWTLPAKRQFSASSQSHQISKKLNVDLNLSKDEAVSFVEDILKIKDPLTLREKDPFQLLNKVQKNIKLFIPFTNLVYINRNGTNVLPLQANKSLMFQRQGGGCFIINSFTKVVLQNLGYQAYLIGGNLPKARFTPIQTQLERCPPGTQRTVSEGHIGLIVQNVTHHGSKHLMEPGTRHPILQVIPLNFARVSPEYNLGHYSIRLFKDVPGIVHLCKPKRDENIDDNTMIFEGKKWELLITYRTLRSLSIEECEKETNNIIQDRDVMPDVHDRLVIFGFSQGRWTSVVGRKFVQYGSRPGLATRKEMKNNTEMVETICNHFPQYPQEWVAEVLMFWCPDRHVV